MIAYFKQFFYLLIVSSFFFHYCGNIASYEEVTDPESLRPVITMERSMNNETGVITSTTKVYLKDINNHSIAIDNGRVEINGHIMKEPNNYLFERNTDYYISNLTLIADTLYTFKIFFSDSVFYEAMIETPEIDLNQIEATVKLKRNTDLTVSWLEKDYRYPQFIYVLYYQPDGGFHDDKGYKIAIRYPYLGTFKVDGKYIKYTDRDPAVIREVRLLLLAQTSGALDVNFQPGGSITCSFKIYQDIEIY